MKTSRIKYSNILPCSFSRCINLSDYVKQLRVIEFNVTMSLPDIRCQPYFRKCVTYIMQVWSISEGAREARISANLDLLPNVSLPTFWCHCGFDALSLLVSNRSILHQKSEFIWYGRSVNSLALLMLENLYYVTPGDNVYKMCINTKRRSIYNR